MEQLGNSKAEDALEALVQFNEDMNTIGLNAYQLEELLENLLEEHSELILWMNDLETQTLEVESDVMSMVNTFQRKYNKIIYNI